MEIWTILLFFLIVTVVSSFPTQISSDDSFRNINTDSIETIFSSRTKRSIVATKCVGDEIYNGLCYFCGRFYDSIELYNQCCRADDSALTDFCEQVYSWFYNLILDAKDNWNISQYTAKNLVTFESEPCLWTNVSRVFYILFECVRIVEYWMKVNLAIFQINTCFVFEYFLLNKAIFEMTVF